MSPQGGQQQHADVSEVQAELDASAAMPWCGQAEKLGAVEKEILSHFDHQVVMQQKLMGGEVIKEPQIKYRTKYEKAGKERKMSRKGLNATRMGETLLKSEDTPDAVKEQIARKMRSGFAKEFLATLKSKRAVEEDANQDSELLAKRKASKVDGNAHTKVAERQASMERYVVKDPPMPPEHFNLSYYFMAVFFFMCRIPFAVVDNHYFRQFLIAVRPTFQKQLHSQVRSSRAQSLCMHPF